MPPRKKNQPKAHTFNPKGERVISDEYRKWWTANHVGYATAYSKKHNRIHRLHAIYCIKRNYPVDNKCEICGRQVYLHYHHWGKIIKREHVRGIWVCTLCHRVIENPDRAFKVLALFAAKKEQIDREIDASNLVTFLQPRNK